MLLLDRRFRIAVFLAAALIILWFSLDPAPPVPDLDMPLADKVEHFAAYALLAFLGGWALARDVDTWERSWRWGAIFAVLYGALLEILQMTLTRVRMAEWGDLAADLLGALCVYLLVRLGVFLRRRREATVDELQQDDDYQ
jgi:VanZ family protein